MFGKFKKQVLEGFKVIGDQFESFKKEVANGFKEVNKEINGMKNEINGMKIEIDGMKSEFGSFKEQVLERFDGIDQKLDEHTKILDEHSQQIDSLRTSVILIEDKVMTEFPALFEAFELHQEMHKDYDEKNSYLSLKIEEDSIRISALEDKVKFV